MLGFKNAGLRLQWVTFLLTLAQLYCSTTVAQDGAEGTEGIKAATRLVGGYFATAQTLLYAIGGIVGLIGAVKVYSKWSHGDNDTTKTAAAWFSACIFLVVVAAVLKSFFKLQ